MSLDTYTNLQSEVANWLNRQDLTTKIPTFIRIFEAQVERALRKKGGGVREMMTRVTENLTAQYHALPTDYAGMHSIQLQTSPIAPPLEFASPTYMDEVRARYNSTGQPLYYSVVGSNIEVAPAPDDTYSMEITYFAKLPKLATGTQETNWLLDDHPDLYLYGALLNAAPYLGDDERIQVWSGALSQGLEDLGIADEYAKTAAGSPLKVRFKAYG